MTIALVNCGGRAWWGATAVLRSAWLPLVAGRRRSGALRGSDLAALPRLHAVLSAAWRTAGCGR